MIEIDWELAYLPWFENQPDPRSNLDRTADDPIECEVCDTELEWRSSEYAYCPSCRRMVPSGTHDADHLFAKNYTFYIRK